MNKKISTQNFLLTILVFILCTYLYIFIFYKISNSNYKTLVEKENILYKTDVEAILYLYSAKKNEIKKHQLSDILLKKKYLKNQKYYIQYSLFFNASIDIIYNNKNKVIWIYAAYE